MRWAGWTIQNLPMSSVNQPIHRGLLAFKGKDSGLDQRGYAGTPLCNDSVISLAHQVSIKEGMLVTHELQVSDEEKPLTQGRNGRC